MFGIWKWDEAVTIIRTGRDPFKMITLQALGCPSQPWQETRGFPTSVLNRVLLGLEDSRQR